MLGINEALLSAKSVPALITIVREVPTIVGTLVAFILHDPTEGSLFGLREFVDATSFLDVHDFIYELWLSSDLIKVG